MDRVFFEQLAMPLFDQLYNHARWLTGDRVDAEDLVQETYAKALKGFGSFAEGTNLRAWMFRILRNIFMTSKSGLAARNTEYLEDDETVSERVMAHAITPELLLLRSQSEQAVFAALEALPVNYRQIILLSEVEEMSRLSRARAGLRALLGANVGQEVR